MLSTKFTIEALKVSTDPSIISKYLTFTIGALLVYDITDMLSFDKVKIWMDELKRFLPIQTPILIAGNKSDLKSTRAITLEEAEA
jgi:GTPase SAR1 family protein